MKKGLKLLSILITTLIALLVIAGIAVTLLVDPNDYKQEIAAAVKEKTGRELAIEGDIGLSLFPWLGLQLGATQLSNAPGFGDAPFARIEATEVRVKLLPLLRKELEMDTVTLNGLQLTLIRNEKGIANWDDLATSADTPSHPQETTDSAAPPLAALEIGGVAISNARIVWDDRSQQQRYAISNLALESGTLSPGKPFDLSLAFDLDASKPELKGHLALKGEIAVDVEQQRYSVKGAEFATDLTGPTLPGGKLEGTLRADVAADLLQQLFNLSGLDLDFNGAKLTGKLDAKQILTTPAVEGEIDGDIERADRLLAPFAELLPKGFKPEAFNNTKLATRFSADLGKQTLQLPLLKLSSDTLTLEGEVHGSKIVDAPSLEGALKGKITSAKPLLAPFTASLPAGMKPELFDNTALETQFSIDLGAQTLKLPKLKIGSELLQLDAKASGSKIIDAPNVSGTLQASIARAEPLFAPFTASLPEGFKADALDSSTLESEFTVDLGKQTLQLPKLAIKAAGLDLQGNFSGNKIIDAPTISGNLTLAEFSLRQTLGSLGLKLPETSDPNVLGRVKLQSGITAGSSAIVLKGAQLKLDETTAKADFSLGNFSKPVIRFDVAIDTIDADRYLLPKQEPSKGKPAPATAAAGNEQLIPVELLRGLDVNGSLTVKQLKAFGLNSRDVTLTVKAKDGLVHLHPATAQLYKGSYSGDIQIDARGKEPQISINEHLSGVEAEPLLKDMMGSDKLSGTGNISTRLTTRGNTIEQLRAGLNGDLAFSFTDGALKGINIAQLIREAKAKYKGQPPPPAGENKTDFSELRGTATVTNGLVRNDDLIAKSPLLRVEGRGTADLKSEQLDYLIKTSIVGTLSGQGGEELADLKGVTIPIKVSGNFTQPKYGLDIGAILEAKAKAAVEEKVKSKVEDKLKDGLKGLFKR